MRNLHIPLAACSAFTPPPVSSRRSIARHLQKHARLMAVLASMDNGKTIRETRDCDVPIVIRHLYHHAGWAQLADSEMAHWKPLGTAPWVAGWGIGGAGGGRSTLVEAERSQTSPSEFREALSDACMVHLIGIVCDVTHVCMSCLNIR